MACPISPWAHFFRASRPGGRKTGYITRLAGHRSGQAAWQDVQNGIPIYAPTCIHICILTKHTEEQKSNKHGQRRTSSTCRVGTCTRGPLGGGECFSRTRRPACGLCTTVSGTGFEKRCRFWLRCSRRPSRIARAGRHWLGAQWTEILARMHPRVGGQTAACVRLAVSQRSDYCVNQQEE